MVAVVASYFSKINIILWEGEREDAIFPFKTYFFNKDFFENNEKRGDTCDEKSQISPLKRQSKGSLLLPCLKMVKTLIYQRFSTLFEMFFKVFSGLEGNS